MRGKIYKLSASLAATVASLAFAAPLYAATLSCTPSSGSANPTLNCSFNGEMDDASAIVHVYEGETCAGTEITDPGGLCTTDGVGADCDNTAWQPGFTETTTYSAKTPGGSCTNSQTYTVAASGFLLSSVFDSADMETAATTAVTQVGPYVIAVFGILLVVGIAVNILARARKAIYVEMGKTPAEIREMQRAESAQRKKDRIPRRGRDAW